MLVTGGALVLYAVRMLGVLGGILPTFPLY